MHEKLTETLLQMVNKNGVPAELKLRGKELLLPQDVSFSAQELSFNLIVTGTELLVKTTTHEFAIPLIKEMELTILSQKIELNRHGFYVKLSNELVESLGVSRKLGNLQCHRL